MAARPFFGGVRKTFFFFWWLCGSQDIYNTAVRVPKLYFLTPPHKPGHGGGFQNIKYKIKCNVKGTYGRKCPYILTKTESLSNLIICCLHALTDVKREYFRKAGWVGLTFAQESILIRSNEPNPNPKPRPTPFTLLIFAE